MEKKIALLGSTGSIGTQTLEVVRHLNQKGHRFEVVALAAGSNIELLAEQIREFKPQIACIKNKADANLLRSKINKSIEIVFGEEGLRQMARLAEADLLVNALVGAIGLEPTLEAIKFNIDVALANKESLAIGGHLVKEALKSSHAQIIPVDSEHSGVFQVIRGLGKKDIERIVLTASGGALRDYPIEALQHVTKDQVLAHPTWQMGARITVDSATLVNKGLEVIEAHWLFELPFDKIEVVIHPQSIVHALIELKDGSVMAQMSAPDMRTPIQYALTYPQRVESEFSALRLRPCRQTLELSFRAVDHRRYPAFGLMQEAGRRGGTLPAVLNAADEVLVERFLADEIRFTDIAQGLQTVHTLASSQVDKFAPAPTLADLWAADRWARETVIRGIAAKA